MNNKDHQFETLAVHAGQKPEPEFGAVMTPVYQTSTYRQKSPGEFRGRYDYSRSDNPTRAAIEANLAALEGGRHGLCFSSGMASIDAILHLLQAGDHIVMCDDVYGGSFRIVDKLFKQLGVGLTMVDMTDVSAFSQAFTDKTKLVWVETPTNPMLKIIDLQLAAQQAREHNALLVVDNTFATPYLQKPFAYGADVITHSTTKYIGGHSDLIGGFLCVNDDVLEEKLRFIQLSVGAVPGPWESFLLLRSTKTLALRMDRHCQNAAKIADFLAAHAKVEQVIYPGLTSHPQHTLAMQQMKAAGGMISIVIRGGLDETRNFLENVRVFTLAESLGGVESLVNHPAIMTHASVPPETRQQLGITDNLVRLSIGIEHVDDLIADLDQALKHS